MLYQRQWAVVFFIFMQIFCNYADAAEKVLSAQDINLVMVHFTHCWSVSEEEKNDAIPIVKLMIHMSKAGKVESAILDKEQQKQYETDTLFKKYADLEMKAMLACSPVTFLPVDAYNQWEDIAITLNPCCPGAYDFVK